MANVAITNVEPNGSIGKALIAEFDHLMQRVRNRAYDLFEKRGHKHGADLEDWLRAEEELLFPAKIEMKQEPGRYTLQLSLPEFGGNDLKVYTFDGNLIVNGASSENITAQGVSSERSRNIFFQWPLPAGVHSDQITASFNSETLAIDIPVEAQSSLPKIQASESQSKDSSKTSAAAA